MENKIRQPLLANCIHFIVLLDRDTFKNVGTSTLLTADPINQSICKLKVI